jgi:hypothetical protein
MQNAVQTERKCDRPQRRCEFREGLKEEATCRTEKWKKDREANVYKGMELDSAKQAHLETTKWQALCDLSGKFCTSER